MLFQNVMSLWWTSVLNTAVANKKYLCLATEFVFDHDQIFGGAIKIAPRFENSCCKAYKNIDVLQQSGAIAIVYIYCVFKARNSCFDLKSMPIIAIAPQNNLCIYVRHFQCAQQLFWIHYYTCISQKKNV